MFNASRTASIDELITSDNWDNDGLSMNTEFIKYFETTGQFKDRINMSIYSRFADPVFIQNHPEMNWNFDGVSMNPRAIQYYEQTGNLVHLIDMKQFSRRASSEFILAHPEMAWNIRSLCRNPNLNDEIITRYMDDPDFDFGIVKEYNQQDFMTRHPEWNWPLETIPELPEPESESESEAELETIQEEDEDEDESDDECMMNIFD